ncbi:hypothetical protein [Streptomyces griseiscabiei]|uniref:Tetratricopeptide repeat protein n=1 Tax=Streptomyces griseiscabiei TaxID=2993540 RepID=A0ABU4L890_9ACTN|nr:hypothetical protein [Streptomyces griseiscabiei]MBZ3905152.1 hypothetical protein [Streptomyces griseiscabiei]MDX2911927.1 hypothetical protein [Streptomyces griseiscabiei]
MTDSNTTTAAAPSTDPVMDAIARAVTSGRAGDVDSARRRLLDLWATIGVTGDPLHRCALAHHLADLHPADPARALAWDVRALDAADAATERRVQAHDARLRLAAFYPSLHLNLADGYRRLASFEAAAEHIEAARRHTPHLAGDAYGDLLRTAIEEVAEAVARRDTARRTPPAPPAAD